MSKKQWMVLLMLFLAYLLLGALIFHHIESNKETLAKQTSKEQRIQIYALLNKYYVPDNKHNQKEILEKLTDYCGKPVTNVTDDEEEQFNWDFYNSFYFAYTVVSTIGYGNLSPTDAFSRTLMMLYALIGIPMNGILLAQLGEFFGQVFVRAHEKYKSYKEGKIQYPQKITPLETGKAGLAVQIFMYLSPGFITFIFFPAFIFSHFENWTYHESVYYAFVTLTTIGFGDLVAGQNNRKGYTTVNVMYKIFLIAWLSFGLGYIFMIMTFISRGMRSKKIVKIEHKLAMNLKQTQSKIWNEFNKEIDYLRRVFNELQLSKVKRVYVDEYDYNIPSFKLSRSNSFPDMRDLAFGGLESCIPPHPRRRANSEVAPTDSEVMRVVSETDLQRIDKKATFATHAMIQPAELLARLVNILGYIPPPTDDDDDLTIMRDSQGEAPREKDASSRRNSGWILGGDSIDEKLGQKRRRARAISEVGLEKRTNIGQDGEWTWSGPTATKKIQELMKARSKSVIAGPISSVAGKESKSKFSALPKVTLPKWVRQLAAKKSSEEDPQSAAQEPPLDPSEGRNQLLEETSVAEFLRVLTALHVGYTFHAGYQETLQRRMTSASKPVSSLMALFSPPGTTPAASSTSQSGITKPRRFSLVSALEPETHSPYYRRRSSTIGHQNQQLPSRFGRYSLRPVTSPASTPPQYSSYLSIDECSNPPPYSTNFIVPSCSEEPLMGDDKGPVPNTLGRFSLRPAQIDNLKMSSRALPRWKASLLHRQMSQRRSRAFSLSDVHQDIAPPRTTSISPLAFDPARQALGVQIQKLNTSGDYPRRYNGRSSLHANQKTVTIVSPGPIDERKASTTSDLGSGSEVNYSFSRARRESVDSGNARVQRSEITHRETPENPEIAVLGKDIKELTADFDYADAEVPENTGKSFSQPPETRVEIPMPSPDTPRRRRENDEQEKTPSSEDLLTHVKIE